MSRVTIGYEGEQKLPNQLLLTGSVQFNENERYPVSVRLEEARLPGSPVGYASNVQREADGRITAEIDDELIPEGRSATFFGDALDYRTEGGVMVVTNVRLREIMLLPKHLVAW